MFRTALLKSARQIALAAPKTQASIARPVARSSLFQKAQIAPSARFQAIRCYAASAGLSKDEVQGRILDLLKNFDKVMVLLYHDEAHG
jgi:NADH dehydrogenase (ubiquinone) 1 alpha/beta subcomplex 1